MDISFDHVWPMLDSREPADRIKGWKLTYHLLHGGQLAVTKQVRAELFRRVRHHDDDQSPESRACCKALAELAHIMHAADAPTQKKLERAVDAKLTEGKPAADQVIATPAPATLLLPGSLGRWVFEDFAQPSWLAYLADSRPRDEKAVMLLVNLLSGAEFPLLQWKEFRRGAFAYALPTDAKVKAVLMAGRPGLFHEPAAYAGWRMKNARYSLPLCGDVEHAPQEWPDPAYHRVLESIAPGAPPLEHCTHLDKTDGVLTDYAIIQKYEVLVSGHTVVVVVCAGCTFLGTFAAAHWLTHEMLDHHQPGVQIPAPPSSKGSKRRWLRGMEALLMVTAKLDPEKIHLPPMQFHLLDLRVDDLAWDQDAFAWAPPKPRHIVLFHRKGQRPTGDNITSVWLDGQRAQVKGDHETLRLLAAVCGLKKRGRKNIPIGALAKDTTIWADGEVRDAKRVVAQLRLLSNRHLGQLLDIQTGSGFCTLDADVRFVETDDGQP